LFDDRLKAAEMRRVTDEACARKCYPDSLLTGKVSKFLRATASKIGLL